MNTSSRFCRSIVEATQGLCPLLRCQACSDEDVRCRDRERSGDPCHDLWREPRADVEQHAAIQCEGQGRRVRTLSNHGVFSLRSACQRKTRKISEFRVPS